MPQLEDWVELGSSANLGQHFQITMQLHIVCQVREHESSLRYILLGIGLSNQPRNQAHASFFVPAT